jgi:Family of unknown function (DUF6882)
MRGFAARLGSGVSFAPLFDRFALDSAERQEHAQEVVGGRPFTADLSRGVVGFEPGLEMRAELVGTEADDPGSWMWSWANPSGFPDHVTAAARHARGYGEQHGVGELTTGEIPLDGAALGYRLTVVTCGLAGGYAYYPAAAAPGTTAYMLLDHPSLALPPVQLSRALRVLTAVSASGQVADWRYALVSYAGQRGLEARPAERWVELVHPHGGGSIRVDLDERGRVANIAGRLQPVEPTPRKRWLFGLRKN